MEIDESVFTFFHPFSMVISGVSQSGKSLFVNKLLSQSNSLIFPKPERIILSYEENQESYQHLSELNKSVEFRKGLDFDINEFHIDRPSLIVIDDQMRESLDDKIIQSFFTRIAHHRSVSVILITQNLFPKGKHARDVRLNIHYQVIMKSPTFASQICYLGRQLFPKNTTFLEDAYKRATEKPYSYLILNLHPKVGQILVFQGIFENEEKFLFFPK